MQINTGLVTIDPDVNPSLVNGNESVNWTQVMPGNIFICNGMTFQITTVDPTSNPPQLTISPNWPTSKVVDVPYVIVRDYTLNFNLPLLNQGDLEAAAIWSRTVEIIDTLLGTSGSTTNEVMIVMASTPFIVGNMVGIDATTGSWFLCTSDTAAHSTIIGCVTQVASDKSSFKIKTEGRISGIEGVTMAPGQTLYLRSSLTAGGTGQVNLGDQPSAGSTVLPVMVADGVNSGYLLNLASAITSLFTATSPGLVPPPGSVSGKVLSDSGWVAFVTTDNSIFNQHLNRGGNEAPNWAAWEQPTSTNLSVYKHITDLNTRLNTMETSTPDIKVKYARSIFLFNGPGTLETRNWSFEIPMGVTSVIVTMITSSNFTDWDGDGYTALGGADIRQPTNQVNPVYVQRFMDARVLRVRVPVVQGNVLVGDLGYRTDKLDNYSTTMYLGDASVDTNKLAEIKGYPYNGGYTKAIINAAKIGTGYILKTMSPTDLFRLVEPTESTKIKEAVGPKNNKLAQKIYDNKLQLERISVKGAVVVEWGLGAVLGGI